MAKRMVRPYVRMTGKRVSGYARTIKRSNYLVGKSDKVSDMRRSALPPGKRISKRGNIYYETRRNRADISKKL